MTTGHLALTLKFFHEEDQWVGVCLELSTSTYGDTFEEVRDDLQTLVREHLEIYEEEGKLDEFLEWCCVIPEPAPVDPASIRLEQFHVQVGAKDPAETQAGG